MNSSKGNQNRTLAVPLAIKARNLVTCLVNLPDNAKEGMQRLQRHFAYVLEDLPLRLVHMEAKFEVVETSETGETIKAIETYPYDSGLKNDEERYRYVILPLRNRLRAIWRTPDRYSKQLGIFRILQDCFLQGDGTVFDDPLGNDGDRLLKGVRQPSRTERLLWHFLDLADHLRYCEGPECLNPYFVASRRSRKYCSAKCAEPAQREFKRRWWASEGKLWRATRAKK
jgi:hypothetical protein